MYWESPGCQCVLYLLSRKIMEGWEAQLCSVTTVFSYDCPIYNTLMELDSIQSTFTRYLMSQTLVLYEMKNPRHSQANQQTPHTANNDKHSHRGTSCQLQLQSSVPPKKISQNMFDTLEYPSFLAVPPTWKLSSGVNATHGSKNIRSVNAKWTWSFRKQRYVQNKVEVHLSNISLYCRSHRTLCIIVTKETKKKKVGTKYRPDIRLRKSCFLSHSKYNIQG